MTKVFKTLCIGIGSPIDKSLGPLIHNSGLVSTGLDDRFLYVSMEVSPDKLTQFIDFARSSNIRGITVTLPHKESVIPLLDHIDETAAKIGAVNTIVNNGGMLVGFNTDYIGAVQPLKKITGLKGKKAAVIGAGGAAKAFVYGLVQESSEVTIFNRTKERADKLAKKFGCKSASLEAIDKIKGFDIICNASSVGFSGSGQADSSPVPAEYFKPGQIVFDAVYSPLKTKLLESAEAAGAKAIPGSEMLLHQGYAQFKHYYETEAPKDAMRQALMDYLADEK